MIWTTFFIFCLTYAITSAEGEDECKKHGDYYIRANQTREYLNPELSDPMVNFTVLMVTTGDDFGLEKFLWNIYKCGDKYVIKGNEGVNLLWDNEGGCDGRVGVRLTGLTEPELTESNKFKFDKKTGHLYICDKCLYVNKKEGLLEKGEAKCEESDNNVFSAITKKELKREEEEAKKAQEEAEKEEKENE